MSYVTFSAVATSVNVQYRGVLLGYKINSVLHGGRVISLAKNNYYYIPHSREVVSYRGTKARTMVISDDGKYNFQEKLMPRGVVAFKVDAHQIHADAFAVFA
jgi:archaellum component FlaF (FlaF/FlaG flagellin family)